MPTYTVREKLTKLNRDCFREERAFSADMQTAHRVLHNPHAEPDELVDALDGWIKGAKVQPCIFGRISATNKSTHYCLLRDLDLQEPDEEIASHIRAALLRWKQRSVDPRLDSPAHSFVLCVASPQIAFAAPDSVLADLVELIRGLWGCEIRKDKEGNDVSTECLFLRDPRDGTYRKFEVNIDYFGAQGDGRWWHDHRFPGGVAFTANVTGHMAAYQEWYQGRGPQKHWLITTAMGTIEGAASTPFGKATVLRDLVEGRPFLDNPCPFDLNVPIRASLRGKDWTRYEGFLHTDHSIRKEFFGGCARRPSESRVWLQDFTYLYDADDADYRRLIAGEVVPEQEVYAVIGTPSEWRTLTRPPRGTVMEAEGTAGVSSRPADAAAEIRAALEEIRSWSETEESHDHR